MQYYKSKKPMPIEKCWITTLEGAKVKICTALDSSLCHAIPNKVKKWGEIGEVLQGVEKKKLVGRTEGKAKEDHSHRHQTRKKPTKRVSHSPTERLEL